MKDLVSKAYINDLQHSVKVSKKEEYALYEAIKNGDKAAFNKLITANLRFVLSVVKNYENQGVQLDDLIQAGNLGLIAAAKRFDASKNFKFVSYAVWWIRQAIFLEIAKNSRIFSLSVAQNSTIASIQKILDKYGYATTPNEIKRILKTKLPVNTIQDLRTCMQSVSLNNLVSDAENNHFELIDTLHDHTARIDEILDSHSNKKIIQNILKTMSLRKKIIIEKMYDLNNTGISYNLTQVGEELHLTRERVRQLKKDALRELKVKITRNLVNEKLI